MRCRACESEIELRTGERVGFRDSCSTCGSDLHCCLNCAFHDPSAHNECREPNAERVSDRERNNRCDCFSPGDPAGDGTSDRHSAALADLDALFKK
jgi:hypothetical protein